VQPAFEVKTALRGWRSAQITLKRLTGFEGKPYLDI